MIYLRSYESPLGQITIASDGESIIGVWFEGQKYYGSTLEGETTYVTSAEAVTIGASIEQALAVINDAKQWLDIYFSGKQPDFIPPLKFNCSEFRKEVWEILMEVPYGETTTYGEIADKLAKKHGAESMSAQAVGGAVGHNPFILMIPCHRVIGKDGSLTGYAAGVEKKAALIEMEKCSSNS